MRKSKNKSLRTATHRRLTKELRRARNEAKLTQVQLAEILGWPQSDVSKVENGERRLDVVEYLEWADAIGFDASSLISQIKKKTA